MLTLGPPHVGAQDRNKASPVALRDLLAAAITICLITRGVMTVPRFSRTEGNALRGPCISCADNPMLVCLVWGFSVDLFDLFF